MRVFVTGSTGFIGTAVVKELLSGGHHVLGLTRSDNGAEQLKSQGAEALHGTLEDLDILKKGAAECDAAIHLAFGHDFANFARTCAIDRAAITAMGTGLAAAGAADGRDRALVITSGTMMLAPGTLGDEDAPTDTTSPLAAARGPSETVCLDFARQGVRASVVRLPPTTHGAGGVSGFMGPYVTVALQKGVAAYIGDGSNRWCACHRDDAARLYRLAVEKAKPGSVFHAVAEEGIPLKDIATEVGEQMNVPVVSIPTDKAQEHFGFFHFGPTADNIASSAKTRERLGWTPTGPTVAQDVPAIIDYSKSHPYTVG